MTEPETKSPLTKESLDAQLADLVKQGRIPVFVEAISSDRKFVFCWVPPLGSRACGWHPGDLPIFYSDLEGKETLGFGEQVILTPNDASKIKDKVAVLHKPSS